MYDLPERKEDVPGPPFSWLYLIFYTLQKLMIYTIFI